MSGVEILEMTPILEWHAWTYVVAIIASIVLGIVGYVLSKEPLLLIAIAVVVFFICAIIFGCLGVGSYETGRYEYTVIVDDSVQVNEFFAKYEVIDRTGKVFTVIDRQT